MIISSLGVISPILSKKLSLFESTFQYPLGLDDNFTISHHPDYRAFYSSMGEATVLIAESDKGEVLGTFCSVIRTIKSPFQKGNNQIPIAYLGDSKIIKAKQKSRLFYRLAIVMQEKLLTKTNVLLGIVMEGTKVNHLQPKERLGLPAAFPINRSVILCIQTSKQASSPKSQISFLANEEGFAIFEKITLQDYFLQSDSYLRSKLMPIWMAGPNETSCGKLEDTLMAKRLFNSRGELIKSSHLSYFAFTNSQSGYQLLLKALEMSFENGFSSLFVAMSEKDYELLKPHIQTLDYVYTRATIFGNEHAKKLNLRINTAEI